MFMQQELSQINIVDPSNKPTHRSTFIMQCSFTDTSIWNEQSMKINDVNSNDEG